MRSKPPSRTKIPYNSSLDTKLTNHQLDEKSCFEDAPDKSEYLRPTSDGRKGDYYHDAYLITDCWFNLVSDTKGYFKLTVNDQKKAIVYNKKAPSHEMLTFDITVDHGQQINAGQYALIGVARLKYWIVGQIVHTEPDPNDASRIMEYVVEKESVIRMHNPTRDKFIETNPGIPQAKVRYV